MSFKENYKKIRRDLKEDSGFFCHFHTDGEDKNFCDQLKRLPRRGVLKQVHKTLYIRNI